MRVWMRSHLTYANVMATLAVFLVLGGGTAMAAYVVSSNSQVGPATIFGHKPPSGKHANIIGGSVNGTDLATGAVSQGKLAGGSVNSSKVLDGSLDTSDFNATSRPHMLRLSLSPAVSTRTRSTSRWAIWRCGITASTAGRRLGRSSLCF